MHIQYVVMHLWTQNYYSNYVTTLGIVTWLNCSSQILKKWALLIMDTFPRDFSSDSIRWYTETLVRLLGRCMPIWWGMWSPIRLKKLSIHALASVVRYINSIMLGYTFIVNSIIVHYIPVGSSLHFMVDLYLSLEKALFHLIKKGLTNPNCCNP